MKAMYKIIIFFAVFLIVPLIINSLGVFPITLYSDIEMDDIANIKSPTDMFSFIFVPTEGTEFMGIPLSITSISAVIGIFVGVGAIGSIFTHSFIPFVLGIMGAIFVPMITKSLSFFDKLFHTWDSTAMAYLGIVIGLGVLIIVLITVLETPTQGRSG